MTNKVRSLFRNNQTDQDKTQRPFGQWRKIKERVFLGIIVTLENEANARVFPSLINIFTWVQVVFMPFTRVLGGIWGEDSISQYMRSAVNAIGIAPLFDSAGSFYRSVTLYIAVAIIFTGCLVFFLSANLSFFKSLKSEAILKLNKFIIPILTRPLVFPLMSILLANLGCPGSADSAELNQRSCFSGVGLANFVLSVVFAALYLAYGALMSFLYYETNQVRRLAMGAFPSSSGLCLFLFLVKMAALNSFVRSSSEEEYFVLAVLLISNAVLFKGFYTNSPFYEGEARLLARIMSAVSFWTVIAAFMAKTLSPVTGENQLALWAFGIVLIIGIVLLAPKYDVKLLLSDPGRLVDCWTICKQQSYLFYLWQTSGYRYDHSILIDGFMTIHQAVCETRGCPLRARRPAEAEGGDKKAREREEDVLLHYIDFNFQKAIARFPGSIDLRMHYVLFLEQVDGRAAEIIAQLSVLESLRESFYHDFFIFKYRLKALGHLRSLNKNSAFAREARPEGLKASPAVFSDFTANMEKCCLAYLKFWTHLIEEAPSLEVLRELGREIVRLCGELDGFWERQKVMPLGDRIKLMMLYGNFQKHIMNKPTGGDVLLAQAKELLAIQQADASAHRMLAFGLEAAESACATIAVSGALDNIGEVLHANMAACLLFGYPGKALLGFNIKALIPSTFNMHHDTYLERAGQAHSVGRLAKDTLVFGLSKQGYLVPLFLSVHLATSSSAEVTFLGQLRAARFTQATGFVLTDYKGRVEAVSAGLVALFGLDAKTVGGEPFLNSYFAGLFDEKETFLDQGECPFPPKFYKNLLNDEVMNISIEVGKHQHYLMIKEYYVFKFVRSPARPVATKPDLSVARMGFEFWVDNESQIVGRLAPPVTSESFVTQEMEERLPLPDSMAFPESPSPRNNRPSKRPRLAAESESELADSELGADIKTFKLDNGKVIEPENITDEDDDRLMAARNSDTERQQLRLKRESQEESLSLIQNIKSNRLMKDHVTRPRLPPPAILVFVLLHLLFGVGLVAFCVEFAGKGRVLQQAVKYQEFITIMGGQASKFQRLADANLQLLGRPTAPANATGSESDLKSYIDFSIVELENLVDQMLETADAFPAELSAALTGANLTIYNANTIFYPTELVKALKQILTQNTLIKESNLTDIVFKERTSVYYSVVNIVNDCWTSLFGDIEGVLESCAAMLGDQSGFVVTQTILGVSLGLLFLLMWAASLAVNRIASRNLSLFLDIAVSELRRFAQNCEFFITNIHTNTIEQANYDDLAEPEGDAGQDGLVIRRGRRNNARRLRVGPLFYLKFLLAVGVSVGLALWLFFSHASAAGQLVLLARENANITTVGGYFHMISNVLLLKVVDVAAQVNPPLNFTLNADFFRTAFRQDSLFYDSQLETARFHSPDYQAAVNGLLMNDFCSLGLSSDGLEGLYYGIPPAANCTNITAQQMLGSFLEQGLRTGIAYYQDSLYSVYLEYLKYQADSANPAKTMPFGNSRCKTNADYQRGCALSFNRIRQNFLFQNVYLSFATKKMTDLFYKDLEQHVLLSIRLGEGLIFGLFLAFSVLAYLLVYLGTFLQLRGDFYLMQRMVLMVPLETIRYSMFVKDFFKEGMQNMLR